jgi:excisionase family DNA binding protein
MAKQLISTEEVLELTGVDYSTIWRWMAKEEFPLARQAGGTLRWLRSEIDEWINDLPKNQCVHTGVKAGPKRGRPTKLTTARKRAAQHI